MDEFKSRGLAEESEGALCVFLDGFDSPMIIQKRDGAFLYATTDLATIRYRMQHWKPDVVLYVVDHRQHEHFSKLFEAAKVWGYESTEFRHIAFGTRHGCECTYVNALWNCAKFLQYYVTILSQLLPW